MCQVWWAYCCVLYTMQTFLWSQLRVPGCRSPSSFNQDVQLMVCVKKTWRVATMFSPQASAQQQSERLVDSEQNLPEKVMAYINWWQEMSGGAQWGSDIDWNAGLGLKSSYVWPVEQSMIQKDEERDRALTELGRAPFLQSKLSTA